MSNPSTIHNQAVTDPIAHFKSIPWCAALLSSRENVGTQVPDRTPIPSTESAFVRETLNTPTTIKACVTFLRYIKPTKESLAAGETREKPFLEMVALLDVGSGINGYAGTAHGGFYGLVIDEVCGTVANMQAEHGAYTVYLNVRYKQPLFTPAVAVCRGRVVKREGRKLYVKSSFEDKDGNILTEADGMFLMMTVEVGRSNVREVKL